MNETIDEEIARLALEKAALDAAEAEKKKAARLEGLRLEVKYAAELGPINVAFAMVDATKHGEGWIVLKLGSDLARRRFIDAADEKKLDAAAFEAYLVPCVVYPSAEEFRKIVRRRGHYEIRCARALSSLYGVSETEVEGKY